jgi:TMEM175 potassium channel family protein
VEKDRLLAFTDGVIAIIITIMVLELKIPHGAGFAALAAAWPVFLSYVLSFVYLAIYWNNHHHFFHLVQQVDGAVLWANMHLLFWLSLIPFATGWMGENAFAPIPTAVYGLALLMPALAWQGMQWAILRTHGGASLLALALGRDLKGKLSPALYAAGIGLAFIDTRLAGALYLSVALIWLVPDQRIERVVRRRDPAPLTAPKSDRRPEVGCGALKRPRRRRRS